MLKMSELGVKIGIYLKERHFLEAGGSDLSR